MAKQRQCFLSYSILRRGEKNAARAAGSNLSVIHLAVRKMPGSSFGEELLAWADIAAAAGGLLGK
jgi:hypothetical protein